MAQTTVDHDHDHAATDHRDLLRSVLPAGLAVLLLLGVLMAGALVLQDLVDVGVWMLGGD